MRRRHRSAASAAGAGPSNEGDHEPLDDLALLEPVAGAPRVLERPLGGLGARARRGARGSEPAPSRRQARARPSSSPSSSKTAIERSATSISSSAVTLGLGEQAQEASLDERMGGEAPVAGRRGSLDRLGQHPVRPRQVRGESLDDADVGNELDAQRIVGRQQRDGPRDQIHARRGRRCGQVPVVPRCPSRSAASRASARARSSIGPSSVR